jgi:hypothetical protein
MCACHVNHRLAALARRVSGALNPMVLRVTKKEIQLILRFLTSPFCFSCPFVARRVTHLVFSATALWTSSMWVLVS